jgi:hypothetical protein
MGVARDAVRHDRRKAQRFADETQRVIDGRREAGEPSGPVTVAQYAERWSAERAARGVVVAQADLARLRKYALPSAMTTWRMRTATSHDLA